MSQQSKALTHHLAQSISPASCHVLAVPNIPGPSFHGSAYAVPANEKPFFSCMAGKLLCMLQNSPSLANLSWFCSFPFSSGLFLSRPPQVWLVPHHPVLPHTPLSVFYQNGGATERNFRLGMDHRGYLNLEGRQTTLGGKLSLFSCFRVLVYFISSSKYYAFYVWPLKLYSGSFVLLPPGSHTQQAGQSLI